MAVAVFINQLSNNQIEEFDKDFDILLDYIKNKNVEGVETFYIKYNISEDSYIRKLISRLI